MSKTSYAVWCLVFVAVAAVACDPEEPPRRFYLEDFETACDGAPCGWSRTTGEAEQAQWVETIHPGEHAIRLSGEVTVRGPEAPEDARRLRGNSLIVEVAGRCDLGNALSLTVVMEDGMGVLQDATVMVRTVPDWTRDSQLAVFAADTVIGGRAVAIILEKSGPGICEVGDITVDAEPFCMAGCC